MIYFNQQSQSLKLHFYLFDMLDEPLMNYVSGSQIGELGLHQGAEVTKWQIQIIRILIFVQTLIL